MGRIQTATFDRYSEESPRHLLIALYDPWVNSFVVPPQIFPTAADSARESTESSSALAGGAMRRRAHLTIRR
jgi:hypothetical protein